MIVPCNYQTGFVFIKDLDVLEPWKYGDKSKSAMHVPPLIPEVSIDNCETSQHCDVHVSQAVELPQNLEDFETL